MQTTAAAQYPRTNLEIDLISDVGSPTSWLSSTESNISLRAFVSAQLLGSISTLIDVVRQSPPSPLGTHHFTLLFVAWSPLFFFGAFALTPRSHKLHPTSVP
ncbi:hypothetical protein DFP72DRAFT_808695 [Ephemerocybe angulata]|uniref:Uncharacterized protein n=1 Tax=Ephemerocybe angulata TaxID=980116 RepID=A0A8H6I2S6_9AGAR|nr:hypothetical protein DFP72DRAFT_808695 [Tulosesus angulatus]